MPTTRRHFRSNRPFEINLRVKEGLPFVPYDLVNLILTSSMARAQRDNKVDLCHYKWMPNHAHQLVTMKDAEQCAFYYQEVQKKTTESYKRLLGVEHLSMWEGDPIVAEILDVDKMIQRIAYLYANAGRANLVDKIEDYPGLSSWQAYQTVPNTVEGSYIQRVPWVQFRTLPKLSSNIIDPYTDAKLTSRVEKQAKIYHDFEVVPNAWCKAFGIVEPGEIAEIKESVIIKVRDYEKEAREKRELERIEVMGSKKLKSTPIFKEHTPKKREKRIYVLSTYKKYRKAYIDEVKKFCEKCKQLYKKWKDGATNLIWPPGAFRAAGRPMANLIYD